MNKTYEVHQPKKGTSTVMQYQARW